MKKTFNAIAATIGITLFSSCATYNSPEDWDPTFYDRHRNLTSGEVDMAKSIFADSLEYDKIHIQTQNFPRRSKAYWGKIRLSKYHYHDDISNAPLNDRKTFIHELAHIWQESVRDVNLVSSAAGLFIRHAGYGSEIYDYGDIKDVKDFDGLNIEQQASIIEDFYENSEKIAHRRGNLELYGADGRCETQIQQLRVLQSHLPHLDQSVGCKGADGLSLTA